MVIYLDVLLLSNIWVNALLLYATAGINHSPLRTRKAIISAAIGSVFSLTILLPPLPLPVWSVVRIFGATAMIILAFGFHGISRLLRQTIWLILVSILFSGTIFYLGSRLHTIGFYFANSYVYMDISLLTLLFGATVAAAISSILKQKRDLADTSTYFLHIRLGERDLCMEALADTGNTLRDVFSGKPVVICPQSRIFPLQQSDAFSMCTKQKAFRMLPVSAVTGTKLLPAFQPDAVSIRTNRSAEYPIDVMLALTEEQTPAIVPACCFRQ